MNALQKIAVLLVAVSVLHGCASYETLQIGERTVRYYTGLEEDLDPNRPLPSQPQVPTKIMAELVAKPLVTIDISLGDIIYYDSSLMIQLLEKKANKFNFTQSPKLSNPSAETVETAQDFKTIFKKVMLADGFKVVDGHCGTCLRLDIDFIALVRDRDSWSPTTIVFARTRGSYDGIEVIRTRDDLAAATKKNPITIISGTVRDLFDFSNMVAAIGAKKEFVQAWTIAILGQRTQEKKK